MSEDFQARNNAGSQIPYGQGGGTFADEGIVLGGLRGGFDNMYRKPVAIPSDPNDPGKPFAAQEMLDVIEKAEVKKAESEGNLNEMMRVRGVMSNFSELENKYNENRINALNYAKSPLGSIAADKLLNQNIDIKIEMERELERARRSQAIDSKVYDSYKKKIAKLSGKDVQGLMKERQSVK